jgi:hypothetical protein
MSSAFNGLRASTTKSAKSFAVLLAVTIVALFAITASASAAIGVSTFSLTPSTTVQGANPDLAVSATRSGSDTDDLKTTALKLPDGLNYTVAATAKCSSADFDADNCPAASVVGSGSLAGKLQFAGFDLLSGSGPGTIYALSNTQIGGIYRPSGIPKIAVKATISGSAATGLTLTAGDYPRTTVLFGFIPVDLTISGGDVALNGKSGATKTGPVVVTNPTTCGTATSTLTAIAYNGTSGSKSSAFTVTDCGTTTTDNVAPTVNITAPTAGQVLTTGTAAATWTTADTAQAGVTASGVNDSQTTCALAGPTASASALCPGGAKTFTGLANGSYTLTVTAKDNAGNTSTPATRAFSVNVPAPDDNVAPTINITAPTAAQVLTTSSAAATWTITDTAQAGSAVSGVNDAQTTCALAGPTATASALCPGGSKTFTGLANGSYTLTVVAKDNLGNTGSSTRAFSVNVPPAVDNVAPTVNITAPTAAQVLTTSSAAATWTITDAAQAGVTASGVNDAQTTCALAGPTPTASALCPGGAKTFSGLANGSYTLTVIGKDNAGNTSTATRAFSVNVPAPVDNVPPTINITAPTAAQVLTTSSAVATWTLSDTAQAGATASGVKDSATTCALAGPTATASALCPGGTKTFTGLANGSYTLTVTAFDNANNTATATRAFSVNVPPAVDNVAPTVNITAPTAAQVLTTNSAAATWTTADTAQAGVTASGVNDAQTTCALAGPTPTASGLCPGGAKTFTGLANGSYTLTVTAKDNAGNTSAPATRAFSVNVPAPVDNVPPTINITAPTAAQVLTTSSAVATWTLGDTAQAGVTASGVNDAATTCALAGPTATASALCPGGTKTFTGLANGSYTLTVTAFDNASNTATATRAFSVNVPPAVDNVAPTVTITAPTAAQVFTTNTAAATWTTADTAQAGVTASGVNDAQTTCALAGPTPTASGLCPGGAKTFTGLANGSYTLTVTTKDNAGNTSAPATRAFNVAVIDNVVPTVNITAPTAAQVLTTNSAAATWTTADTAQVGVSAAGVNDAQTTCALAGPTPTASGLCPGGAKTFNGLANGSYTLTVTAKDFAGNTSAATTRAFSVAVPVDTVPPTINITAPTAAQVLTTSSAAATWTITDGGTPTSGVNDAQTTCALAGPTPTASGLCPGGAKTFTGLANGSYTLTVTAFDNASNTATATRAFSVNVPPAVDNVAPTVNITAPTAAQVLTTNSAAATWTTADTAQAGVTASGVNDAQTTCALAGPTATASALCPGGAKTFNGLANGSYTLSVIAKDNAGNTSVTATRAFSVAVVDNVAPTVNITAPTAAQVLTTNSAAATWTTADTAQAGVTASGVNDAQTTCALAGPTPTASGLCPGGAKTFSGLANGSYTLTVTAKDNAGNTSVATTRAFSVAVPVDTVPPTINITAPTAAQVLATNSAAATWTITDGGTPTSGVNDALTTCALAGPTATASALCPGGAKTFSGLANGSYTLTVSATDNASNTATATRAFSVNVVAIVPPVLTVSQFAAPSANATSLSQAANKAVFTATNSPTSFSCRSGFGSGASAVGSQAFAPCTSPWSPTIPAGITSGTNIDYQIKATNAGGDSNIVKGFSWYDTRGFTAIPSVTPSTTQAGAHPDVTANLTVQGFDDAKTVDVAFPDGLMGSLAAIPQANRCTLDQATAGNCPASALIATGSGHVTSATDGTVAVGAPFSNGTANLYLIDAKPASGTAIPSQYAAGVALQVKGVNGTVTGAQGDVNAQGFLSIGDNGRNIKLHIDNIPRQTLTGHAFHVQDVSLTIAGTPAGAPVPLTTNPHYCGTFNANRHSPGSAAFTDQWGNAFAAVPGVVANSFWGSGVSYQGDTTPEIQASYIVTGCATVPFSPSITASISSTAAATPTTLNATLAFTTDNSPMRQALVRLPGFVAPNLAAFGDVNLDQCPTTDITFTAGAFGTGAASYSQFSPIACPASSIVGKAILTTPLLPGTVTADVYQVNKAPVPNIGIYVDPNKYGNPQGVTIGLFGTTTTPQIDPLCDPTDTDTNPAGCPSQIVAQFASIPDVSVTSMAMTVGNVTGRTLASGQVFPNVLNIAQAADPACVNAGARITSNLTPWSGTAVASPQSNLLIPTGCNQ